MSNNHNIYTFTHKQKTFIVDEQNRQVHKNDKIVPLTSLQFDLLFYLAKNPNKNILKTEFCEKVWNLSGLGNETLKKEIYILRKALGIKTKDKLITTIRKSRHDLNPECEGGYKFIAEVTESVFGEIIENSAIVPITTTDKRETKTQINQTETEKSERENISNDNVVFLSELNVFITETRETVNKIENDDENIVETESIEEKNLSQLPLENETLKEVKNNEEQTKNETYYLGKKKTLSYFLGIVISYLLMNFGLIFKNTQVVSVENLTYIVLLSIFYGLLYAVGLVLESAYQFDKFGWNASLMALPLAILNIFAMFCSLSATNKLLDYNLGLSFFAGLGILVFGATVSCLIAYSVLPNFPITAAKFQTQPAFAAFCKNVFIYFLSIYSVFGILLYCLVFNSSNETKNILFPLAFFVIWIFLVGFSYISTSYMSDNLLTLKDGEEYKYHGLFFSLLLWRAFFCFAPTLCAIIYYFFKVINITSIPK